MTRPIGLAAQAIPGIAPARLVQLARIGGFDRVGLGIEPDAWTAADTVRVRRALADEGVTLQDVEVIRLHDRVTGDMRRRIDIAAELGAGWIITVCFDDDMAATADLIGELVRHAAGTGVMPILEFGRFTSVGSIEMARAVAGRAGCPILLDPLHLARSGGSLALIAGCAPAMLPYAQLCDAGPPPAATDRASLLAEARGDRRDIGAGTLDLRAFVAALPPETPLMNEVRSTAMTNAFADPEAHARHLGTTMRRWLAEAGL